MAQTSEPAASETLEQRSALQRAQRALGFMGLRHRLVLRLFRLAGQWLDQEILLTRSLELLQEACDAEAGSVLLLDEETGELVFTAATGPVAQEVTGLRIGREDGIAGWAVGTGRVVRVSNVHEDPHWHAQISQDLGFDVRCVMAAPIKWGGGAVGCVELINKLHDRGAPFASEDEELLRDAAECVAILLALADRGAGS